MNCISFCLWLVCLWAPEALSQDLGQLSGWRNSSVEDKAYNQFALELLVTTAQLAGSTHNVMLSPLSVWSVLALLTKGSAGNTRKQLRSALHLDMGKAMLRDRYQNLALSLKTKPGSSVTMTFANMLVTDENRPVSAEYESVVEGEFGAHVLPVNFHQVKSAVLHINSWVSNITHGRIPHIVNEGDLRDPQLIVANAVFFQGLWKFPFNESNTSDENFLDEEGRVIGTVPTMRQTLPTVFGYLPEVESHLLVLPYEGEQFSLVIAVSHKKVPLLQMVERIKIVSLGEVLAQLSQMQVGSIEEVRVHLPRFSVSTDFVLNAPLTNMGITDAFSSRANFRLISSQDIYVSRLIHKAEIQVDEKGTVASAATGAVFTDKMMPAVFKVNRPFAYFVIENEHKTVVFAGTVVNPTGR